MESLNIDILESIQKEIGLLRTMIYDSFYGFGIGIYDDKRIDQIFGTLKTSFNMDCTQQSIKVPKRIFI